MAESSFELVFVSPNIAKMLLKDLYDEQRPYHDTYAQRYAADMAAGLWNTDNPQPIIISDTGKVIDGQHRLHAVIISGCTVPVPTKTALAYQRYLMRLYTGAQQAKPYAVASALVNFADAVLDGRECVGYNKRETYVKKWEQAYAKGPHLC